MLKNLDVIQDFDGVHLKLTYTTQTMTSGMILAKIGNLIEIKDISTEEPNLEDIFIDLSPVRRIVLFISEQLWYDNDVLYRCWERSLPYGKLYVDDAEGTNTSKSQAKGPVTVNSLESGVKAHRRITA